MSITERVQEKPSIAVWYTVIYDVAVLSSIVVLLFLRHYWAAFAVFAASEAISLVALIRRHFRIRKRLRQDAEDVNTSLKLIETVLNESDDYAWSQTSDGKLMWRGGMVEAMNWGSNTVSEDEFLSIFDYEYGNMIARMLRIDEDGVYVQEALATIGERQWWEFRMRVSTDRGGKKRRRGMLMSIEERKKQEAEMMRIHEMALNAQERSGFVRSMLHEIRTPLNSIIGFSQLISSPDVEFTDEEYDHLRHEVLNENDALVTLIENMLTLSHLNNGTVQFNMRHTNVRKCAERAVDIMSERFRRNDVSIRLDGCGPDSTVWADGNAIVQILLRLLDNCIKFCGPGSSVTIDWKEENDKVAILVSDDGPGIPEDKQLIVFKRFAKLNPYSQGTGIGLAIAEEYAEKMDGSIVVKSSKGQGSSFVLRFRKGGEAC